MNDHIKFLLNGELVTLGGFDPGLTVLRYLREQAKLKGTKEGCAEGDCGACTAVSATLENGAVVYKAFNTCIQFMGSMHGKALFTIEGISTPAQPHPVQKAMVECHGSQCGFCTPGFVMSLFGGYCNGAGGDRKSVDDLLAGNLCRCTGYRPIVDAAASALSLAKPVDFDGKRDALAAALAEISAPGAVRIESEAGEFFLPATTDELADILAKTPKARIVAGGTDLGLHVTKRHIQFEALVSVAGIAEMNAVVAEAGGLRIGAAVTYETAWPHLEKLYPDMGELIRRIGSVQVRSSGTIGGNIGNGSPIADSSPVLIAAGATLTLRKGAERRTIPLEDYFIEYGRQDLRPGEFIEEIFVPRPAAGAVLKAYKVSKRFDQDISAVCGIFNLSFAERDGVTRVASARIAFGGMAGTPLRATDCEAFLVGKPWTEDTVADAKAILDRTYEPISDARASAGYRRLIASNLLTKYFLETTASKDFRLAGRLEEFTSWTQ